jgi:hypothetical protein
LVLATLSSGLLSPCLSQHHLLHQPVTQQDGSRKDLDIWYKHAPFTHPPWIVMSYQQKNTKMTQAIFFPVFKELITDNV